MIPKYEENIFKLRCRKLLISKNVGIGDIFEQRQVELWATIWSFKSPIHILLNFIYCGAKTNVLCFERWTFLLICSQEKNQMISLPNFTIVKYRSQIIHLHRNLLLQVWKSSSRTNTVSVLLNLLVHRAANTKKLLYYCSNSSSVSDMYCQQV